MRHGAVAAVAELVLALRAAGQAISTERLQAVAGIVPALQVRRSSRCLKDLSCAAAISVMPRRDL